VTFDASRVRATYPALADGYAYLDGAAGTQVPASVIEAIGNAYRSGIGNTGGEFPASDRSGAIVAEARRAVADLVGGDPAGVILGPSMTALTYRLADALSREWVPGDEVVVSRLDHDANVRPWVQAAERRGATVRWARVDISTTELPAAQYSALLSERTKLVAVTAASNIVGTRPDVASIAAAAHTAGALCYVDGVHATPHVPVDMRALGADFYATSAYKWSGPHIGTVTADPALLGKVHPDKLTPAPEEVPGRFERGTAPFADLAGVVAAVDHLAGLAPGAAKTRRERLLASMAAVEEYEAGLFATMLGGLAAMQHVTLYGKAARRAPTAFFNVDGYTPTEAAARLAAAGVNVWNGDNYAWEPVGALGLRDRGGAIRAGLVHYNDHSDVDRLLAAVAELCLKASYHNGRGTPAGDTPGGPRGVDDAQWHLRDADRLRARPYGPRAQPFRLHHVRRDRTCRCRAGGNARAGRLGSADVQGRGGAAAAAPRVRVAGAVLARRVHPAARS
jgi:cysteine desulfurase family protein (TIGR01976 family)